MAQVISYGGISEGNPNTSCILCLNCCKKWSHRGAGMVSLTNNFKFCRLN